MSHGARVAWVVARTTGWTVGALLIAACGPPQTGSATHVMPDGQTMAGPSMPGVGSTDQSATRYSGQETDMPSRAASMICSSEVRDTVAHNLQIARAPQGLHSWTHQLYTCSYLLKAGELRLSVKDLDQPGPGRAYFRALRSRLPGATGLSGLQGLGFPSFQTSRGDVAFLKDHKTLWVDASRLSASDLPPGTTREAIAYGVGAAVVACWSE
ncbi:MAG: hypothetical protein ACRDPI_08595 [Nocardioidaceae bacterium]